MLSLVLILLLPVFLILRGYIEEFRFRRLQKKHNCASPNFIPSFPFGIPFAYNLLQAIKRGEVNVYSQKRNRYNEIRTSRVQVLSRTVITTVEPENIKAVLATQFKDFDLGDRYQVFKPFLGDGIFTLSGLGWQHSRALLRPQFTNEQVSRLQVLENSVQDLLTCIRAESASGQIFDIQPFFFKYTLDTATEFLFGESTDSLSGGKKLSVERANAAQQFQVYFDIGQNYLMRRMTAQRFYFMVTNSEFRKAQKICKDFADYYVDLTLRKVREEKQNPDAKAEEGFYFLRELAKETQDPVIMRDQALNILIAGRDTTASLLSFTMALLIRHKEVWYKLREAILTDFGTGTENITFHTLKRCDYLKYVINETLRLYPVVPFNARQAIRDTTLPTGGGPNGDQPIFIPKDTKISYHTYSLHRQKQLWGEDAEEFKPERWVDISGSQVSWKYIPFNGGPRICIGQQLALTEAAYTIVRIAQNFEDINTTPETASSPIRQRTHLTANVFGGVHANFVEAKF